MDWYAEKYEQEYYKCSRGMFRGSVEYCGAWSGRVNFAPAHVSIGIHDLPDLQAVNFIYEEEGYEATGHFSFDIARTGMPTKEYAMDWVERKMAAAESVVTTELLDAIGKA